MKIIMNSTMIEKLRKLYYNESKHSRYQILPGQVRAALDFPTNIKIEHYDWERFQFIKNIVDFKDKDILDIGGNTGYFSFESLMQGAKSSLIIEGNKEHVDFVNQVAEILSVPIFSKNAYVNFLDDLNEEYFDIIFCLNVVHHLGDDFGDRNISKEKAKEKLSKIFEFFENKCDILIFQMGFNWKGDRYNCLFDNGTKIEMIDFVKNSSKNNFDIIEIGIAEGSRDSVIFKDLNNLNIGRVDELGEFLNRPIFILKSKKLTGRDR